MSTRTRSRTLPASSVAFRRYPNASPTPNQPGAVVLTEYHNCIGNQLNESIIDDPVKGGEKYCKHVSMSNSFGIPPVLFMNIVNERYSSRPFKAGLAAHYSDFTSWGMPTMQNIGAVELKALATDALRQMQPSMNEGLSLVNFLIELRDVKRMFHLWDSRSRGGLANLRRIVKGELGDSKVPAASKEVTKMLAVQGAAWNLNWNFGWKPFISDILDMYKALANFEKKLNWLRSNAGKLLRRNYRKRLDSNLPAMVSGSERLNFSLPNLGIPNTHLLYTQKEWRWVSEPMYHATLIYRYSMSDVQGPAGMVRAFLSQLGVELDPSIVWNAIPFSFLLDWVVDVGSFLRTLRVDNLGIRTEVVDFSHSVKFHAVATTSVNPSNVSGIPFGFHPVRYDEYSYYERVKTIPDLYTLSVDNPSYKQWSLAGSLIIANGRVPRKHTRRASRLRDISV